MAIEFLSLDLGCGDFILTYSIAFFYSFGLTSIVYLHNSTFSITMSLTPTNFFAKLETVTELHSCP